VAGAPPAQEFRCTAKTRYRQADQACSVQICDNACIVEFDTQQRAVTPGQSVVFYRDEECLGGSIINATDAPFGGLQDVHALSPAMPEA
jgi:tRNA-specific 2-thiouridylase